MLWYFAVMSTLWYVSNRLELKQGEGVGQMDAVVEVFTGGDGQRTAEQYKTFTR